MTSSTASSHGTPVYMTVWSLLPPSFLSNTAFNLGCGILHTNIWLPDINTELAFGGHDVSGVTGIFSLPRDGPPYEDGLSHLGPYKIPSPGPPPIADCHYVGAWFLGYAGAPAEVASGAATSKASASSTGPPSSAPWSETGRWAAPQRGFKAFREPGHFEKFDGPLPASTGDFAGQIGELASGTLSRIGGWFGASQTATSTPSAAGDAKGDSSHSLLAGLKEEREAAAPSIKRGGKEAQKTAASGRHPRHSGARARSIAFAMRTIQELKASPTFHGTSYDLLSRNCNHFSSQVCSLLVGSQLPGFVNRAAGLGARVAPYLPPGILEMDTALEEEDGAEEGGDWEDHVERDTKGEAGGSRAEE